ncbi:MAG: nucleotidyltransferase family protein [Pseudomonadota bacterium]
MKTPPLIRILADPRCMAGLDEAGWDVAIRQARAAGLLATLYHAAEGAGVLAALPERVGTQLLAAHHLAQRHFEVTQWEVREIHATLENIGVPLVVLKGAAYVMADLEAARGRLFGDVDILVPRGALADVERALGRAGWMQENRDAYDDRYYRKWMHEIPARKHAERGTVIDVHHNILPLTARNKPRADLLWQAARPIAGFADLYVLAPEDMLLHSAAHLFLNGEFDRGLRDLNDFSRLAREFGGAPGFWEGVRARAGDLDLVRPLGLAVRHANRLLQTAIPETTVPEAAQGGTGLLDAILTRGLRPNHSSARDPGTAAALFALYVRGHYLRMPFHLLLPHLLYKATLAKYREQKLHDRNQELMEQFRAFLDK